MKEKQQRFSATVKKDMGCNYLLYLPREYDGLNRVPLVLFLHGAGERGNDLSLVKTHGLPRLIAEGKNFPFIVVAPQCPTEEWWSVDTLNALLDHITTTRSIDEEKIYLTGLSMGGYGTWALADAYPERFAAIAPVCGPFVWIRPERFKNIPCWCFHGALDTVIPLEDSVRLVQIVRNAGGSARLTIYPDAGHDAWTQAYENPELYRWLLRQRRNPCKEKPRAGWSPTE